MATSFGTPAKIDIEFMAQWSPPQAGCGENVMCKRPNDHGRSDCVTAFVFKSTR